MFFYKTVQTLKLIDTEFIEKLYTTIGHNPMLYEFVLKLTNKDVGNYKVSFLNKKMMPGNVVVINLASVFSWKDLQKIIYRRYFLTIRM